MGGFGAGHLGFRYPKRFGPISMWGSALHRAEFFEAERPEIFSEVFGNDLSYCRANLPQTLAADRARALRRGHAIRIVVGADDPLRPKSERLHELLETLGIPHSYVVVRGASHSVTAVHDRFPGNPWGFYATIWHG
jgi:endo-1,4-beta-xylanase